MEIIGRKAAMGLARPDPKGVPNAASLRASGRRISCTSGTMSVPNAGPGAQLRATGAFLSLAQQRGDLPIAELGAYRQGLFGWASRTDRKFFRIKWFKFSGTGYRVWCIVDAS